MRRQSDDEVEEQKDVATVALEWYERHLKGRVVICVEEERRVSERE